MELAAFLESLSGMLTALTVVGCFSIGFNFLSNFFRTMNDQDKVDEIKKENQRLKEENIDLLRRLK